jgi:hypothetical protein
MLTVQDAFEKLILPHIDVDAAEKVMEKAWLRPAADSRKEWRGSHRRR